VEADRHGCSLAGARLAEAAAQQPVSHLDRFRRDAAAP
jgi:hypothetical protein